MATPAKPDSVKQLTDVITAASNEIRKHVTETSVATETKLETHLGTLAERFTRLEAIIDTLSKSAAAKKKPADAAVAAPVDGLAVAPSADKTLGKLDWFVSRYATDEAFRTRMLAYPSVATSAAAHVAKNAKKPLAPEDLLKKQGKDAHTFFKRNHPTEYKAYETEHAQYQQSTKTALVPDATAL